MSHHKKGRTIHKENKRLDHKKVRAAERQVLDGGNPRQVRYSTWDYRPGRPPVIDDGEMDKTRSRSPRKKKPRTKKDRCHDNPKGRAHEYLADDPVEDRSRYSSEMRQDRICVWCGQEASRWRFRWESGWSSWSSKDRRSHIVALREELGLVWTGDGFRFRRKG